MRWSADRTTPLESTRGLVGAVRFEHTTPCAQGSLVASKGSIVFREILTITTIWGICSSLDSQPKRRQQMEFGHSSVTASELSTGYNDTGPRSRSRIHFVGRNKYLPTSSTMNSWPTKVPSSVLLP